MMAALAVDASVLPDAVLRHAVGWLGLQTTDASAELLALLPFVAVFAAVALLAANVSWVKR